MTINNFAYCLCFVLCSCKKRFLKFLFYFLFLFVDYEYLLVNGMSNNSGMVWDIEHTKAKLGWEPMENVAKHL